VFLTVAWNGCETWSPIVKNVKCLKFPTKTFGPKEYDENGELSIHNEDLGDYTACLVYLVK
jgi:hypothetical protein